MKTKLKNGQKVKVIANETGHGFDIGDIAIYLWFDKNYNVLIFRSPKNKQEYALIAEEFEIINS